MRTERHLPCLQEQEEIFELVSGSEEAALTRNKKLCGYPKYTSNQNQNKAIPSEQLWNKEISVMLPYRWKIWLYSGKTCPSINATVADFQDWESNLIIATPCSQKNAAQTLGKKSYLYATGTHFYSSSNNFNAGNAAAQLLSGLKKQKPKQILKKPQTNQKTTKRAAAAERGEGKRKKEKEE